MVLGFIFIYSQPSYAGQLEKGNSEEEIVGTTDLTSDTNTEISEVLTFDELVKEIANDQGISEIQAARQVISSRKSSNNLNRSISPYAATYRTVRTTFTVTSTYKPSLNFYCETSEGGSFRGIIQIVNVGMNRAHLGTGKSKQFAGTVFTKLEDPNRIYWIVNGDFYDNGTTTGGGSVNIGLGKFANVAFNISHASNHYKYIYLESYSYF